MTLAFLLLVILLALLIDILWLPAFFCAVAAMHWTVSLHLPDPLAPLYAFLIGGVTARLALEPVREKLDRWMK
ncbi:MAG: hypothetical protein NW206_17295 [Hyphomonadaceae bacterium]|nr:hypothetical protein [Hyphomonadaceae bacterium]